MIFIAHRGNVNGPIIDRENTEKYILEALSNGYDCEIDLWVIDNILYLGHDKPMYKTSKEFILNNKKHLWIHCKNHIALQYLIDTDTNYFYHDKDNYTITSKNIIWGNIDSNIINNMICVMPEKYRTNIDKQEIQKCIGICSDYITNYLNYKFI